MNNIEKNEKLEPSLKFETGIMNSFESKFEDVGSHTIHYKIREGHSNPKRTFILSHGAFGTANFMKVLAVDLANKYPNSRIILVDQPWHGESTSTESVKTATVHTYAEVMSDFIGIMKKDQKIQGKLNWIGWSMGGSIGMLLDLKGVGIDELTLLNSSPIWNSIKDLGENVPEFTQEKFVKTVFQGIVLDSLQTNISEENRNEVMSYYEKLTSSPEVMVQDVFAILPENYNIQDDLNKIESKTLIISGTEDIVGEVKFQHILNENIRNSKLKMYEDNHLLLVKPNIVKSVIEDIFNSFGE
jgi:pimeloyl-ACP methyl ester carboxylesterase